MGRPLFLSLRRNKRIIRRKRWLYLRATIEAIYLKANKGHPNNPSCLVNLHGDRNGRQRKEKEEEKKKKKRKKERERKKRGSGREGGGSSPEPNKR